VPPTSKRSHTRECADSDEAGRILDKLHKCWQTGRMLNDLLHLWNLGFFHIFIPLAAIAFIGIAATGRFDHRNQAWQPKGVSGPWKPTPPSIFKIFFVWVGRQLSRFVEPVCSCPPSTITPGATATTKVYSKDCPVHGCSCCEEVRDFRKQLQEAMEGKTYPVEEWNLVEALQRLTGACRGCRNCFMHKSAPNRDVTTPDAGNPMRSGVRHSAVKLKALNEKWTASFYERKEPHDSVLYPKSVDEFTPVPGSCANCGATREKHLYNSYMGDVQGAWVGCVCQGTTTITAAPEFRCKCTGFVAVPPPDFTDKVLK